MTEPRTFLQRLAVLTSMLVMASVFAVVSYHHDTSRAHGISRQPVPDANDAIDGSGEDPNARTQYEWLRLHDPATGMIPAGIRKRELAFAGTLPSRPILLKQANAGTEAATDALPLTARGPYNIGGRTRALAYDVSNSSTILAGGVSGGMWRSTDDGTSWTKTSLASSLPSVTCLAQDTRSGHTSTWYYGTGEYLGNSADGGGSDAYFNGDGLFKSTDDGVSWTQLTSTSAGIPEAFTQYFDYVWDVATDPSSALQDVVYAATYGAIFRSTDGGATWDTTLISLDPYWYATDVQVTTTGVVYAALSSGASNSGILRSTDGMSWTNITPSGFPSTYGRIVIGIAPSDENVVYFLVEGANGTEGTDQINTHQIWKYTYGSGDGSGSGGTWVNRGANLPDQSGLSGNAEFDTQGGYDMLVKVKPDDEDFLLVGGTNLYRSTDAFATTTHWTRIGGYADPSTYSLYLNHHPDLHSGMFEPGNTSVFLSGDDGGVQRTSDITAGTVAWTPLNNGYLTTQFYTIALDHGTSGDNTILGGMQDNGTWETTSTSPTATWYNEDSGDGTYCAIADGGGSEYVSSEDGDTYRLTGSGYVRIDPTGGSGYLFVNPFVLDPTTNSTMYFAGGNEVWRNSDITAIPVDESETTKSTNWAGLTHTKGSGGTISALGVSKSPANILYYGTSNGKVFRIDDANSGNPTPTDVWSSAGFPSGAYVSCIAVDQEGGDTAIVVFSNYSVISLYWTTDGGSSWTDISGNLEQNSNGSGNGPSCRWATIVHGSTSIHYFVATSTGVYSSTAINGTSTVWSQEGSSEIGNSVTDMIDARESDGTVIIGTHGNGVFSGTIADPLAVELASFTITSQRTNAILQWTTTTEVDNEGWGIERSAMTDQPATVQSSTSISQWTDVGFVRGSGTSEAPKNYSYTDNPATPGLYAYRLKQIDRTGAIQYSKQVQVDVGSAPKVFTLSQNYPNPFNPTTTIEFTLPADGHVTLKVYDLTGREVATLVDKDAMAGVYQQAVFDGSQYSSGVYFYRITAIGLNGARFASMKKMMLLK